MSDLSLEVNFEGSGIEVDAEFGYSNTRYVSPSEYTGELTVVPSHERHILETTGKMLNGNVTVEAAPTSEVIFTENGEYLPPEGEVGFRKVVVNNPTEWTTKGIADGSEPYGDIDLGDATRIVGRRFAECINLTGVTGNLVTRAENEAFTHSTALKNVHLPRINAITQRLFWGCSALEFLYLPSAQSIEYYALHSCPSLQVLILPSATSFGYYSFDQIKNDYNLVDVVFGHTRIINTEVDAWRDSSFDVNGNGGNIYIRKALFDHLGDGSNSDYLANAKWAAIYAKGNLAFKQIEGSEYETYMPGGEKYNEEMGIA